MMKLDILKFYLVLLRLGLVLVCCLNFGDFEPRCSYKKECIYIRYTSVAGKIPQSVRVTLKLI